MKERKSKVGKKKRLCRLGWKVEEIETSVEKLKEKERKIKCRSIVRSIENF
jgi:hypothetical protein